VLGGLVGRAKVSTDSGQGEWPQKSLERFENLCRRPLGSAVVRTGALEERHSGVGNGWHSDVGSSPIHPFTVQIRRPQCKYSSMKSQGGDQKIPLKCRWVELRAGCIAPRSGLPVVVKS
jgi:hypothetical protein